VFGNGCIGVMIQYISLLRFRKYEAWKTRFNIKENAIDNAKGRVCHRVVLGRKRLEDSMSLSLILRIIYWLIKPSDFDWVIIVVVIPFNLLLWNP
jgi:hypothetical protein